jgi:hypothetical protein
MSKRDVQHLITKACVSNAAYLKNRGVSEGTIHVRVELPDGEILFETLRIGSLT